MTIGKKIFAFLFAAVLAIAAVFYFRYQVFYSHGSGENVKIFKIEKGQGGNEVASNLKGEKLISGKIFFYYYMRKNGLLNKILPGEYGISGNMTIPEIAKMITTEKESYVKITFPEGWDSKKMAARMAEKGLDGEGFLKIINDPQNFKKRYSYLQGEKVKTLEGYLFPDTYYFKPDITAENIVGRLLDNFDSKLNEKMREDIVKSGKDINDTVIMASIVEGEVKSSEDRKIVSGIFWKRIGTGMPLQSCATLAYVLGEYKKQYSYEDTQTNSLFNTYQNKGLPPSPVNNPGIDSISAAIYPTSSSYLFFLSDPKTGKTIFAKTAEEHSQNKIKAGL